MKDKYLRETRMVDFSNPAIQKLIQNMKWKEMGEFERIKAIYNYVRDTVSNPRYLERSMRKPHKRTAQAFPKTKDSR